MYNTEDLEILQHLYVHFAGQWEVMLEYYDRGGKGALLDRKRIEELAAAKAMLREEELAALEKVQELYKHLREVYEIGAAKGKLVADLILADGNEEEAIEACIANPEVVPELIKLVRSQEYSDPLYPGYGFARELAAHTLGCIGAEEAIVPLFESIGSDIEEEALEALVHLPCQTFMIDRLQSRPLSNDTERAAVVLASLDPNEEIAEACIAALQDPKILSATPLSAYLVLAAAERKEELRALLERPECPATTREEIQFLLR